jgi:hypothetical protein
MPPDGRDQNPKGDNSLKIKVGHYRSTRISDKMIASQGGSRNIMPNDSDGVQRKRKHISSGRLRLRVRSKQSPGNSAPQ